MDMNKRDKHIRGSMAIESVIVMTMVIILLVGCTGTLLTLYIDHEVDWAVKETIANAQWTGLMMDDINTQSLGLLMRVFLDQKLTSKKVGHLISIQTDTALVHHYDQVYTYEMRYRYQFLNFKGSRRTSWLFYRDLTDDGLAFDSFTVYITRTGIKYHKTDCHHLRQSKIAIDQQHARSRGYEACKNCHAPHERSD